MEILGLLIKIDRKTVWLLFILMILFILSGYRLTGKFGLERIMDMKTAMFIHLSLDILLIILFVLHSGLWIYIKLVKRRKS